MLFSDIYICITCTFTWSQSCSNGVAVHPFLVGYNQRRTQSSHICAQVKRIQNGLQEFLEKSSRHGHQLYPMKCYEAQLLRINFQVNKRRKLRTLTLIHPVVNPNIHELTYCHNLIHFEHPNLSLLGSASPFFLQTLK